MTSRTAGASGRCSSLISRCPPACRRSMSRAHAQYPTGAVFNPDTMRMGRWRSRLPVLRLIWRNEARSEDAHAAPRFSSRPGRSKVHLGLGSRTHIPGSQSAGHGRGRRRRFGRSGDRVEGDNLGAPANPSNKIARSRSPPTAHVIHFTVSVSRAGVRSDRAESVRASGNADS
jgi:hypothetical protein